MQPNPLKQKIRAVIDWARRHWLFLVLIVGGAGAGAAFLVRRKTNAVSDAATAIKVMQAKSRVRALEAQQRELDRHDAEKANEILRLDAQITAEKKVIAAAVNGKAWDELSDEQIRAALREAGL